MKAKLIIALLIAINCYTTCGAAAALRRTPKVYNALITTDENLTSSRAYPVIQPTIHETGLPHYPFGPYNPYGFYNTPPLVRLGQPIAPGLTPRDQLPYPLPANQFPPQIMPHPPPNTLPQNYPTAAGAVGYPLLQNAGAAVQGTQQPEATIQQTQEQQASQAAESQQQSFAAGQDKRQQQVPNEKLPIPLNEFGLPPALIPFQQYPNRHPVNLPPYAYNQFPLLYNQLNGFRDQYLPPYEYYPSNNGFAVNGGGFGGYPSQRKYPSNAQQQPNIGAAPTATNNEVTEQPITELNIIEEDTTTTTNFDNIKNGSKSKNSDVPDVPPPPIPTGAKSKQSS